MYTGITLVIYPKLLWKQTHTERLRRNTPLILQPIQPELKISNSGKHLYCRFCHEESVLHSSMPGRDSRVGVHMMPAAKRY